MLTVIRSMKRLSFGKLMEVYSEGNLEIASQRYFDLSVDQGMLRAEEDFYNYLRDCFFAAPDSAYYIWQESGSYVCALRLEPYRDGLLLEALETAPGHRKQGYAFKLLEAVLASLAGQEGAKVYSHISHSNLASIGVHKKCGFRRILDYAVYIDGSVSQQAGTYLCDI